MRVRATNGIVARLTRIILGGALAEYVFSCISSGQSSNISFGSYYIYLNILYFPCLSFVVTSALPRCLCAS